MDGYPLSIRPRDVHAPNAPPPPQDQPRRSGRSGPRGQSRDRRTRLRGQYRSDHQRGVRQRRLRGSHLPQQIRGALQPDRYGRRSQHDVAAVPLCYRGGGPDRHRRPHGQHRPGRLLPDPRQQQWGERCHPPRSRRRVRTIVRWWRRNPVPGQPDHGPPGTACGLAGEQPGHRRPARLRDVEHLRGHSGGRPIRHHVSHPDSPDRHRCECGRLRSHLPDPAELRGHGRRPHRPGRARGAGRSGDPRHHRRDPGHDRHQPPGRAERRHERHRHRQLPRAASPAM
jgi:hypothetical protein